MDTERPLSLVYLLENSLELWGGVQTVFREADALTERGHRVTILSKTEAPDWHSPLCEFRRVPDFESWSVPDTDLVIGTYCTTVPGARQCRRGRPVHYCQGYEGDSPKHVEVLHLIESIYRLPGVPLLAISTFLADRLRTRFDKEVLTVPYGIPEGSFRPEGETVRTEPRPFRVGLVGPFDIPWKDLRTGVAAARLAFEAGLDLVLVRASPTPISEEEREAWGNLPVEEHTGLRPEDMPAFYRSLDLFLGTSNGGAEGFFLPAIEAMASGVPTVLSDIACFRSYGGDRDRDYAVFVPPGDFRGFAEALVLLWGRADLRQTLRDLGVVVAGQHGFRPHVDGVERAFQSLVPSGDSLAEGGKPWIRRRPEERGEDGGEAAKADLRLDLLETGIARWAEGERTWALEAAEAATRLFPESPDAWNLLGRMLCQAGSPEAAVRALERGLDLAPRSPALHEFLGRALLDLRDYEGARTRLSEALENGMPGARVRAHLAMACLGLGRRAEAEEALRAALSLDPRCPEALELQKTLDAPLAPHREEPACAS